MIPGTSRSLRPLPGGQYTLMVPTRVATPITFPVLVTGNPSHTIKVTKSGYNDWQQSYLGNPAVAETISVHADLVFIPVTQPTTLVGAGKGYYSISSVPSVGTVYFDGSYKGTTPVSVEVASQGTPGHTVTISLYGYETWSTSLSGNPASGQTIPVTGTWSPYRTTVVSRSQRTQAGRPPSLMVDPPRSLPAPSRM